MRIRVVFAFLVVLSAADRSQAISVPFSECPNGLGSGPQLWDGCCYYSDTCDASNGPWALVNQGTAGLAYGGTLNCDNCNSGCPENPPPPQNCIDQLTVSVTQTFSISVAAGASASIGADLIAKADAQWSLTVTGEASRSWNWSNTVQCGSSSFTPCVKGYPAYTAQVSTKTNQQWQAVTTYTATRTVTGNKCWTSSCNAANGTTYTNNSGTRTSTMTSTTVDGTATCKTNDLTKCS